MIEQSVVTGTNYNPQIELEFLNDDHMDLIQSICRTGFVGSASKFNPVQITSTTATNSVFGAASGLNTNFKVGDLVFTKGAVNAANNGLHVITTVTSGTDMRASGSTLVDETLPADFKLHKVGVQFTSGDAVFVAPSGGNPAKLTTTTYDLTTIGLVPGQTVLFYDNDASHVPAFILGSTVPALASKAIVKSVSTNAIEFIDTSIVWSNDTATGKTIRMYTSLQIQPRTQLSNVTHTQFKIEVALAADQYIYHNNAEPSELSVNIAQDDFIKLSTTFISQSKTERGTGIAAPNDVRISGVFPTKNKSSDDRIKASRHAKWTSLKARGDATETPLIIAVDDFSLTINNNSSNIKAHGTDSGIGLVDGSLDVKATMSAFHKDILSLQKSTKDTFQGAMFYGAIRNGTGVTFYLPNAITTVDLQLNANDPIKNSYEFTANKDDIIDTNVVISMFLYAPSAYDDVIMF
jgi:hypothetical protein